MLILAEKRINCPEHLADRFCSQQQREQEHTAGSGNATLGVPDGCGNSRGLLAVAVYRCVTSHPQGLAVQNYKHDYLTGPWVGNLGAA